MKSRYSDLIGPSQMGLGAGRKGGRVLQLQVWVRGWVMGRVKVSVGAGRRVRESEGGG